MYSLSEIVKRKMYFCLCIKSNINILGSVFAFYLHLPIIQHDIIYVNLWTFEL